MTSRKMEYNYDVPAGLLEKVLKRIHREQRIEATKRLVFVSIVFLTSMISIIPAFNLFSMRAYQTGFFHFLSLMFSDYSIVLEYWRNFGLALLETLPAMSLATFLLVAIVMLQSLRSLIKNIKSLNKASLISR